MNIKIKEIFLIVFIFLVSFLVEALLTVSINQWNSTYIPVDRLSENYKDIVINTTEDYDIYGLITTINSNFASVRLQKQTNKGYTPIYANGMSLGMDLVDGREFTENDYALNRNVALISAEYELNVYTENNKKYISIDNNPYEVIGIFIKDENSIWQESNVFINMLSENYMFSDAEIKGRYFLDSNTDIDNSILKKYNFGLNKTVYEFNFSERIDLVKSSFFLPCTVMLLAFFLLLLSRLFTFSLWLISQKKTIFVKYICGGTKTKISNGLYRDWMFLSSTGIFLSVFFSLYTMDNKQFFYLIVMEMLIYILFSGVIINIYVKRNL